MPDHAPAEVRRQNLVPVWSGYPAGGEEILALPTFAGVDKDRLIAELEERFTVYAPLHQTLGQNDDHIPWLPQKLGSLTWRYWDRYRLFLEDRLPGVCRREP